MVVKDEVAVVVVVALVVCVVDVVGLVVGDVVLVVVVGVVVAVVDVVGLVVCVVVCGVGDYPLARSYLSQTTESDQARASPSCLCKATRDLVSRQTRAIPNRQHQTESLPSAD